MSKDAEKRKEIEAEKEQSRVLLAKHSYAESQIPKFKTLDEMLYVSVFHQYSVNGLGDFKGCSKNEHRRALEIARHLFGAYKVPKILNDVWLPVELEHYRRMENTRDLRVVNTTRTVVPGSNKVYRPWYITIASGGSFYKEHVKDFLTRKEAHAFLECPHEISILEALKFAIASQAGADVGRALRIARCKVGFNQLKIDRWRDVLRFFAREVPESVKEADDMIDWISERFNEDADFRISGHGYTIESIRKKVKDWHYALRRLKVMGSHSWDGHLLPNFKIEVRSSFNRGQMDTWTITQILNTKELAAEGTAQHHCVYSYRSRCQSGDCSIWSVKFNNNRKITMEVTNDGRIVQIRGYANRGAHADELHVIDRWARENLLRVTNSRW
jgi:hypothetical protein